MKKHFTGEELLCTYINHLAEQYVDTVETLHNLDEKASSFDYFKWGLETYAVQKEILGAMRALANQNQNMYPWLDDPEWANIQEAAEVQKKKLHMLMQFLLMKPSADD